MKPRVAIHKFSSCDGCQLAFLNAGEDLLTLDSLIDIVHFAEAGPVDGETRADIAFVEGSINSATDIRRIKQIRENTEFLVTIGACATSGGLQALRNLAPAAEWLSDIYATPKHLDSLNQVSAIREQIRVDLELWGCPVTTAQIVATIRALLSGVLPEQEKEKVCMECKRQQSVCVLVSQGKACLGPVTRAGCGALCPRFGRDCYGCFGPSESANSNALGTRFSGLGLVDADIAKRFLGINSHAPEFLEAGQRWVTGDD